MASSPFCGGPSRQPGSVGFLHFHCLPSTPSLPGSHKTRDYVIMWLISSVISAPGLAVTHTVYTVAGRHSLPGCGELSLPPVHHIKSPPSTACILGQACNHHLLRAHCLPPLSSVENTLPWPSLAYSLFEGEPARGEERVTLTSFQSHMNETLH